MAGTPRFTDPISGTAGFEDVFAANAVRDSANRSLRDLDLQTRLFRYPLSFVIQSDAFNALPEETKRAVLTAVRRELTEQEPTIDGLPGDSQSRAAAWEILLATRPDLESLLTVQ